jgi:hypothetical protein
MTRTSIIAILTVSGLFVGATTTAQAGSKGQSSNHISSGRHSNSRRQYDRYGHKDRDHKSDDYDRDHRDRDEDYCKDNDNPGFVNTIHPIKANPVHPPVNTIHPIVNGKSPIVNTIHPIVNGKSPIVNTIHPIVNKTHPIRGTNTPTQIPTLGSGFPGFANAVGKSVGSAVTAGLDVVGDAIGGIGDAIGSIF